MASHNPTFKRPASGILRPPLRSPSPPRAFVEPLSPPKPAPIEPSFNYPPLNSHVDFAVRPESAYVAATPRARAYSTSYTNGHQRTPSTIDTLAEAALAASPASHAHSRNHSLAHEANSYTHAHPVPHLHGGSEPPHKRARSELLPSPFVGQYASRPATSYEAWSGQSQPGYAYNSRVEEAALLLNFQSGGWTGNGSGPTLPIPPVPGPRPHANSFPQDALHVRPSETLPQTQTALLPPFNPQDAHQPPPTLPSPQKTIEDLHASPKFHGPGANDDVEMRDMQTHASVPMEGIEQQQVQIQTPPDETESRAPSADVTASEASEAPKNRRGWPKGKPRGPGAKKSNVEKAASKRAASRKKTPDAKSARLGRSKPENALNNWADAQEARRKSLSDVLVFGEQSHENTSQNSARASSVPLGTSMAIREASPSKTTRRKAAVNSDTICAGCQTTRETANSHGEQDEWISCNGCQKWFHVDCAGFKKAHEVRDVDKFFCTACEPEHGQTTYVRKSTRAHASVDYAELQRGVLKTSEESVEHHYIQPIKDGTFVFDPETFPRMRPEMITREFFEKSGTFVEPICIPAEWNPRPWAKTADVSTSGMAQSEAQDDEGAMADLLPDEFEYDTVSDNGQDKLDMVMPQGLTVRQVCHLVGPDWPIDVIDVKTQNSGAKWTLSRWADYYEEAEEKAIRNVISLEVSQTKLGRLLQRPKVVRDIDLQDDVWPQEEIDKGKYPKVQFYCLMSVGDSYTDFHIDFGGSSVYYHILKGKKTFFFIPPKSKHLKAYEEWNDSPQQNYTFLPSITKECYRVDLSEGDTMLIPSGWIHAVWTPEDSLVIGGNFLNRMSYKNQFKVHDIEKANHTPVKFRYPFFQKIMWYTAIKYLKDDPLPPAVSQLFYEGKKFERAIPIWADFDGDIARNDQRPGAPNARFYSQAEVEGLPDLVNFIFRTVMVVMGRIEGYSADTIKRVNTSIPKGHGEPLDVAKTFALWVAWKRGNEDPPTWAHPDAVLPSSKEEGPPKKLSERKLKELERKEAIAAWRVAPDRQSARVMSKSVSNAAAATGSASNSSPPPAPSQNHQMPNPYYQEQSFGIVQPSTTAAPTALMMSNIPGQHLSTPKTSVLGPKRVACDACRKRRIRCKHKDMVLQASPMNIGHLDGSNTTFQSQLAPEFDENITVTPSKQRDSMDFMNTVMDGHPNGGYAQGIDGESIANGTPQINGQGPQPGTNAYVNANIPMTMNGVPIFGDVPKRGRSKACYECRKSKRRCIHDENGNVDPVKAAETPVPRGTISAKKRQSTEDGSPLLVSKKHKQSDVDAYEMQQSPMMQGHGVLKPQNTGHRTPRKSNPPGLQQMPQHSPEQLDQEDQTPIDPNLFSMYSGHDYNGAYDDNRYAHHEDDQQQQYHAPSQSYLIPSLEQIANEVLVDMNGNEYQDHGFTAQQPHLQDQAFDTPTNNSTTNGVPKQDDGADSAVSLRSNDMVEQNARDIAHPGSEEPADAKTSMEFLPLPSLAHPSIETNGEQAATSPASKLRTSPDHLKSGVNPLPLYQPPAPLSQSPDAVRRPPVMTNGISHGQSSSPAESASSKRKRDSNSATPGTKSAKKMKGESLEVQRIGEPVPQTAEDRQSLELAKTLQQQELGLRRRSK